METQPPAAPGLEAGNRNVGKAIFAKLSRVFYCGGMKKGGSTGDDLVGRRSSPEQEGNGDLSAESGEGPPEGGNDGQRVVREPLLERPG